MKRWMVLCMLAALGAVACSDDDVNTPPADGSPALDAGVDQAVGKDSSAPDSGLSVAGMTFAAPASWAKPIEDYITAGYTKLQHYNFERSIHDLVVYGGRLYLGYGDATYNLGRVTPIEMRYFAAPASSTITKEFTTQEEHLEQYRILDGDLVMAGIDATEDAWLGNVYVKPSGKAWFKSRTLQQGVHVHDCVSFNGAWYAVGSGSTQAEWTASNIHSILWKSADRGKTFTVHDRRSNQKVGDIRWTRLLPVGKTMWMFGYHSDNAGNPTELINATFDGAKRTDLSATHELNNAWVFETHPISAKLGIARGVKILTVPKLVWSTWAIDDQGAVKQVAALADKRVIDIYPVPESGEFLVMTHDEAEVDKIKLLKSFKLRVLVTRNFASFSEVLTWTATATPKSVAYWQGDLYLGDRLGAVWKAKAKAN